MNANTCAIPRPMLFFLIIIAWCAALVQIGGCQRDESKVTSSDTGPIVLTAWAHAGQEDERLALEKQVAEFNRAFGGTTVHGSTSSPSTASPSTAPATRTPSRPIRIELTLLPEGSFNSQVQSAALAGDLPDLLEFDGPFVYNYAWQGHLAPLDDLLSAATRNNLIPSIIEQGTYRGKLYSIGAFDSGLGIYVRPSMLREAGVRIPTSPEDAWSADEFADVLKTLTAADDDGQVLDLKFNYEGEWYTYAFSPALQSAGGDLIDRRNYDTATGVLDGDASVTAMTHIQAWVQDGYVDPNVDDNAFLGGRVPLSWVGHWEYPRYHQAFGDDLAVVPLPDFGQGTHTGQGSWNWGITRKCQHRKAAMAFLEFLLSDEQVLAMCKANGAVPATRSAIGKSERYQPGGPLRLFATQLTEGFAVPRPRTPAYPVISSAFQQAFDDIRNSADVREALDRAARQIDQDIRDNEGYPPINR